MSGGPIQLCNAFPKQFSEADVQTVFERFRFNSLDPTPTSEIKRIERNIDFCPVIDLNR